MMKKIYIIPFLFLFSCATSKSNCEAYGKDDFLVEEFKMTFPSLHYHFKCTPKCITLSADTLIYFDTIVKPVLQTNEITSVKYLTKK